MRAYLRTNEKERQSIISWLYVRDLLCGLPPIVEQDVQKAMEVVRTCEHENARWLEGLFRGRVVHTPEDARSVFLEHAADPKAQCLAEVILDESQWDMEKIRKAAESGDSFAEAMMAWNGTKSAESFEWARRAAMHGERDGFYLLGLCYQLGQGCEKNVVEAKANYLIAAELDDVQGMRRYGLLEQKNDPRRYAWLGRAASRGESEYFMSTAIAQMKTGSGRRDVEYAIGKAFVGQIDEGKRQIFGKSDDYDKRIVYASRALRFYQLQSQAARQAVDYCTLVLMRGGVVEDVRIIIAKMIWDARTEAEYEVE